VAKKCGGIVVQFVSNNKSFKSDENVHIEIINQSLLIISALCIMGVLHRFTTET
jgi:hypothetical protein